MKRVTFLIAFIFTIFNISRAAGYKISGEIKGLENDTVLLGYYFGENKYATDTAFSNQGRFVFQGKEELKGGMYFVLLPEQQFFDIIITEQKFSFSTTMDNLIGNMKFNNSKENPPFYEYINFIGDKQNEVTPLRNKLQNTKGEKKENIEQKIADIDKDVKSYRTDFLAKHKNIFFSKIIKATTEIEFSGLDENKLITYKDNNGENQTIKAALAAKLEDNHPAKSAYKKEEQIEAFTNYKNHFWDHIDFSDERMLRTPIFFSKMELYLNKITIQNPDSIKKSADFMLEKAKRNKDIFKYIVTHITSTYERSKIMGMDAVFVHMVEKYYMQGECDWVDDKQLKKIIERAQEIAPNVIDAIAPDFIIERTLVDDDGKPMLDSSGKPVLISQPFMKDTNGVNYSLQSIKTDWTLLIFYGPSCGHCKKEIPKIKNVYDSLITLGVSITGFAVATEFDTLEWRKFIKEQEIGDWINVADILFDDNGDLQASSNWRDKYDIKSTPMVYLLYNVNQQNQIKAKKLNHEQLGPFILDFIEREEKKKTKQKQ